MLTFRDWEMYSHCLFFPPFFLFFLAHPKGFAELLQPRLRSHRFNRAKGASVFTLAAAMGRGIKEK